jgi:hypothetical protein
LPRKRRSGRGVRPISSTVSPRPRGNAQDQRHNCLCPRSPRDGRHHPLRPPLSSRARSSARPAWPPQPPWLRPRPPRRARPGACRHRRRSPAHLQASRPILRLQFVGSGGAGLSTGKPRRQDGNESRPHGGQAPDQASSGRQTGAAAHARTDRHARSGQSPEQSHTARRQPGWQRPRQTNPPSLTVTRRVRGWNAG